MPIRPPRPRPPAPRPVVVRPAALAIALLAAGRLRAEPFPRIDVGRLCAESEVSVDGGRAQASCRRQEGAARGRLRALWPGLTETERSLCLGGAAQGVAGSYAEMVGCIDTARELARERALPGAAVPRGPNAMR